MSGRGKGGKVSIHFCLNPSSDSPIVDRVWERAELSAIAKSFGTTSKVHGSGPCFASRSPDIV